MDINVASLEDLKWYREWLREQLDLPLEQAGWFAASRAASRTLSEWESSREYMKRRLAEAEARIAVLMA
jgi:hypothetical protein